MLILIIGHNNCSNAVTWFAVEKKTEACVTHYCRWDFFKNISEREAVKNVVYQERQKIARGARSSPRLDPDACALGKKREKLESLKDTSVLCRLCTRFSSVTTMCRVKYTGTGCRSTDPMVLRDIGTPADHSRVWSPRSRLLSLLIRSGFCCVRLSPLTASAGWNFKVCGWRKIRWLREEFNAEVSQHMSCTVLHFFGSIVIHCKYTGSCLYKCYGYYYCYYY